MALSAWNKTLIARLFELPFLQLIHRAQQIHQIYFPENTVELCTLFSIKTGNCPENCGYCPQSAHFDTNTTSHKLLQLEEVVEKARIAKDNGAVRFCMGGAWRSPPQKIFAAICEMVTAVKALGMETCVTLGMLNADQAIELKAAGLDFYNHNLDTSPEYYEKIVTTRTYQDRLDTLIHVSNAGIEICCGGILGLGESREDRVSFLNQLANLPTFLKSVPINRLSKVPGTPLANVEDIDNFEFIRTIAVTRIVMSRSMIRLSAGREQMSEEMQALCFMAGANSMFYGDDEKLFITKNPGIKRDQTLLKKLGLNAHVS